MIYLDTNVIVYAIENHPKYGKACKKILEDIETRKLEASASMLVLVELINVLAKLNKILKARGRKQLSIKENILAALSLPIVWIDLGFLIIERASEYTFEINAIDYLHIASMELNSVSEVLSADRDLDKVISVTRIDPLEY